ncbi:Uncharacterised protein [Mycobacterium tuberculosis]|nr:Uncharacterised protein [Mycobacterium tuberculosis]CKT57443.1 Uncharacterised protein [Mycobacterium tuberculosis]CKT82576.1 Uncharacterised protein [Mycobacterium tuberculosis]
MPNRPVGVISSSTSPAFSSLATNVENAPPGMCLTAMRSWARVAGAQIE